MTDTDNSNFEKIDLLLVDDRPENLLTLEAVLAAPGYNLIKTSSGDQALRYLLDHEPAVILMDVQMPDLDGFETAAIIKRNERTRDIPIIFITAISKEERFVYKGYDQGAVDYIYKPYDAQILRSKVAIFVDLARKTQRLVTAERKLRENEAKERERQIAHLELRSLKREQAVQKKYRELVDGINHGIVWSAEIDSLSILFVSPSAVRILGYQLNQWVDENQFLLNHVHPNDLNKVLEAIHLVQEQKKDVEIEHRFITLDGRELWLHTGIRLGIKEDGMHFELRGLSVDITKIKNAEEVLTKNKERSDFLAEASFILSSTFNLEESLTQLGLLVVDKLSDWFMVDVVNEQGRTSLLSITTKDSDQGRRAEIIFKNQLMDPNAPLGVPHAIRTGTPLIYDVIPAELLNQWSTTDEGLKTLQSFKFQSALIMPLNYRGKTVGALTLITCGKNKSFNSGDFSFIEDLARRVAFALDNSTLYSQAQAAIRARDEFLSIASHELRTPITPLKIQTQSMLRTLKNRGIADIKPEKLTKMLQTSDKQLGRLSRLIDDLLDISRISLGKLTLSIEEFDLVDLVRDIIDRFSSQLVGARCDIEFTASEPLYVHWDRLRIEQVIINLLTNAIKYGPEKPIRITIDHDHKKQTALVSFQDHGIGIAKADQERIFGRFERAVSGNSFGGLGLGLYIVTQILDAHGGRISVESEIGEGSAFTIEIPILVTPQEKQSA